MAPPKKTLYDILGVSQDANAIDIGLAYEARQAQLQGGTSGDPSALALLHEAYEVLGDDARRAAYDASVLTARERAAAAEQAEPDLVIEGGEEEPARRRRPAWMALAAGALVVVAMLLVFLRSPGPPAPPPAPAPPRTKNAAEILADATTSGGPLLAYEMSGRATPIGYAMAIEPGMMVTTCHGIPAGNKLVVRVGAETHPAELVLTDEKLDLCKLAVAGFGARPLALAPEEPKAGDKAYVVVPGKAPGESALADTTVKGFRTAPQGKVLELAMALPPGGDGGGVFDAQGRLIGIASSLAKPSSNASAMPVSAFAEMRSRGVATQ